MRLEALKLRGLGPFADEVDVDLDAIPGPLVAVVGGNGAGKTTLLELFEGALSRTCPTRGSLTGLARDRHAFVEARVLNGQHYTIRQLVDGVSGKGEAVVLDESGAPLLPDTKLRSFDRWAARALPAPEVRLVSTFAVQGAGGFLDLKPAQRKAVLLRALGIERLEAYAADARERARAAQGQLSTALARLEDARGDHPAVEDLQRELDQLQEKQQRLDAEAKEATAELGRARTRAAAAERAAAELAAWEQQTAQHLARAERLTSEHVDVKKRRRAARLILACEDTLQAQAAAFRAHAEQLAEATQARATIVERYQGAKTALAGAEQRAGDAGAAVGRAGHHVERLEARLADRADVEAAAAKVEQLAAKVRELEEQIEAAGEKRDRWQRTALEGTQERVAQLRGGLGQIAEGADDPATRARSALDEDDARAKTIAEAPARAAEASEAANELGASLIAARRELGMQERLAARAGDVAAAAAELEQARVEADRRAAAELEAVREAEDASESLAAIAAEGKAAAKALEQLRSADLPDPTEQLAEVERARARLGELEPRLVVLEEDLAALEQEREALGPAPEVDGSARAEVTRAESRVAGAEAAAREVQTERALAEQAFEAARKTEARVAELDGEVAALELDVRVWTRLANDLGRDGLQALEIDAAGPELTEAINDLLHHALGTRWTVTIETTRLDSRGKKQLEGLDVQVLDTEAGRLAPAETFSGGEKVLIGEAVSLALTMLACRRSGLEGVTLVRDESGAALDPNRSRAWVAMLRRAVELVGASRCLLVSHNPEVAELCDARLVVADGRVELDA